MNSVLKIHFFWNAVIDSEAGRMNLRHPPKKLTVYFELAIPRGLATGIGAGRAELIY